MGWTPQQEAAINTSTGEGNLLVSAAAGSGKTAVLVERVLRKILNRETSVDRLLVVTFTEAAAAEMREKIIKRLISEMGADGHTAAEIKFLKQQTHLAETADIMTIDAFCNRVVRNNFHILGVDPNISIADSAMCAMLREEASENLFERLYKSTDATEKERFAKLIDAYASNRDETGLANVIYHIYDFISSFAEPEKWLDDAVESYDLPVTEMPYAKYMRGISVRAARKCKESLDAFLASSPSEYLTEYAEQLRSAAERIATAQMWDEIYEVYAAYFKKKRGRAKPKSMINRPPEDDTDERCAKLQFIRAALAENLANGVTVSEEELEGQCDRAMLKDEASALVWIVKEFMHEYAAAKDKRNVKEFSDIEHMAYSLFADHEDIRAAYADKYDEILIDEYQDTNGLQDSIFCMISRSNMFMVGDLKQSIYRFRGGDPYIFRDKSESYTAAESQDNKIVLSQNFRSRIEVLDSVNDIFKRVMSAEAGDVEYKGDEMIVRDEERDYYPALPHRGKAHLEFIMAEDKETAEIEFVADKISEIMHSGALVYDKDLARMRPIRCRDIVILERSVKSNGEALTAALSERGIEAFTETESFFARREISVMLSLLSVINNARQDIPLIAVMRSPIGGFSDDELARIRIAYGDRRDFIDAVRSYALCGGYRRICGTFKYISGNLAMPHRRKSAVLRLKCIDFVRSLRRWRGYCRSKSVAELIWTIYEETYFYDMMGAIEEGEEAQFNLRLLYERACAYEKAGFKGLFNFSRYISGLENRDEDLGGAKLIGENHDVVRIMTIHKSKGLEFPYVFVIGCGKRFNHRSDVSTVLLHKDIGMGLPYIYYDKHYMRDSVIKDVITNANKTEMTSEQMRLLYVALTRAREKLYVVASVKAKGGDTPDSFEAKWRDMLVGGKMLPHVALGASGFCDWLCPAAYASADTWDLNIRTVSDTPQSAPPHAEEKEETYEDSRELKEAVYKILDYKYPYEMSDTIPSRTSVTQIKELTIERENIYDTPVYEPDSRRISGMDDIAELMFSPLHTKPSFMLEETERPANEIGTLYHAVMCALNLDRIRADGTDAIDDEVRGFIEKGLFSEEDMACVDWDRIKRYFKSDIGARMLRSKKVFREKPFQVNIPATEYDPSLPEEYAAESVILQGIVDCFFEEDGKYILLDYKTDKVTSGGVAAIKKKYAKQLELYAYAIEKLTGIPVSERWLYLFSTGEQV